MHCWWSKTIWRSLHLCSQSSRHPISRRATSNTSFLQDTGSNHVIRISSEGLLVSRRKYPILQSRTMDELLRIETWEWKDAKRAKETEEKKRRPTRRACQTSILSSGRAETTNRKISTQTVFLLVQPALPVSRSGLPQQERCGSLKSASCRPLWCEKRRHAKFRNNLRLSWACEQ